MQHLELVLAGFIKIVGEADADLASNKAHKGCLRPLAPPAKQAAVEVTSAALVNVIMTFMQTCFGPTPHVLTGKLRDVYAWHAALGESYLMEALGQHA